MYRVKGYVNVDTFSSVLTWLRFFFFLNMSVYCRVCYSSVFTFVQRVCQDAVRGQNMLK